MRISRNSTSALNYFVTAVLKPARMLKYACGSALLVPSISVQKRFSGNSLRKICVFVLAALLPCLVFAESAGKAVAKEGDEAEIYQRQAVYLYNFVSYVEWPKLVFTGEVKNIDLCIIGKDTLGGNIDKVAKKALELSKVQINIRRNAQNGDLSSCNIAYISKSEEAGYAAVLGSLKAHPILTVSEIKGFAENGGVIEFTLKRSKLGFKTNVSSAKAQNLKVGSELLEISFEVIK